MSKARGRPPEQREERTCERSECDERFEVLPASPRRFCTRACASKATSAVRAASNRANGRYTPPVCPCGQEVQPPPGLKYVYANSKKYCSPECRMTYGAKRQRDETKWVTFNCRKCGKETSRRKSSGNMNIFCSNECAMTHTKTKHHMAFRDDDVLLDSSWEGLFYCLLKFLKIPVERADRSIAIEWSSGRLYAPDFYLPGPNAYVEIKGNEEPEDPEKWTAFRAEHRLLVLDETGLELLRRAHPSQVAEWTKS